MDLKQRLTDIADFLQPYQRIWQNEIMLCYPTPFQDYSEDWVNELEKIKDEAEIIRLQKKQTDGLIHNHALLKFYQRIRELETVPQAPSYPSAPEEAFTFLYMTPKKEHEIKRLAPFISHQFRSLGCENVIDIGGGIGLLAQHLANLYDLPVTTLDMDATLQETGRNRYLKNQRIPINKLNYQNIKVDDSVEFSHLLKPKTMAIGLHTCGALANLQLTIGARKNLNSMINFGCCYHKLSNSTTDQNLSQFAQGLSKRLHLNPFALTLASRGHVKMDGGDYQFKLKVKYFRYALHFFLYDFYGQRDMVHLGNSTSSLYNQDFSTYAKEQMSRIHLTPQHDHQFMNQFFARADIQALIWRMLAASFIRDAMGRLLELYLLIDRAILLEEQGYQAQVMTFFDEALSPRNVGIFASKS